MSKRKYSQVNNWLNGVPSQSNATISVADFVNGLASAASAMSTASGGSSRASGPIGPRFPNGSFYSSAPSTHNMTNHTIAGAASDRVYTRRRKRKLRSKKVITRKKKWKRFKKKVRKAIKKRLLRHRLIINMNNYKTYNLYKTGDVFDGSTYNPYIHQQTAPDCTSLVSMSSNQSLTIGQGGSTAAGISVVESLLDNTGWVENNTAVGNAFGRRIGFSFTETLELYWNVNNTGMASFTHDHPLVVDVYECVANRTFTDGSYDHPLDTVLTQVQGSNIEYYDSTAAGFSNIKMSTCGATPWDIPHFHKYWKVLKVERHKLWGDSAENEGSEITDTYESQGFHYIMKTKGYYTDRKYSQNTIIKGVTKTLFWVIDGKPAKSFTSNTIDLVVQGAYKKIKWSCDPLLTGNQVYATTFNTAFT